MLKKLYENPFQNNHHIQNLVNLILNLDCQLIEEFRKIVIVKNPSSFLIHYVKLTNNGAKFSNSINHIVISSLSATYHILDSVFPDIFLLIVGLRLDLLPITLFQHLYSLSQYTRFPAFPPSVRTLFRLYPDRNFNYLLSSFIGLITVAILSVVTCSDSIIDFRVNALD